MFKLSDTGGFNRSLHLLSIIRILICAGQGAAIFYFSTINNIGLELKPLILILILMVIFTCLSWLRVSSNRSVSQQLFFTHLAIDMMVLTLILYFSGGASNPFISYFLVPIAIGSSVLRWNYSLLLALLGLMGYSTLLFFYHPVHAFMSHASGDALSLHLIGMWLNFVVSAALIAYFIVRMAQTIRAQQEELSERREQQLGTDRLVAVATLAANTAHQLGSPINSISLLANELNEVAESSSNIPKAGQKQCLSDLQTQVARCKLILQNLVNTADIALAEREQEVGSSEYFSDILDRWFVIHPEQVLNINQQSLDRLDCSLKVPFSLEPVIFNLLNNAAQSGGNKISISFEYIARTAISYVCMNIKDNGEGIPSELTEEIGTPFNSSKIDGMGIGLYLAFTTIESIGGELKIESTPKDKHDKNETSGTTVSLIIPIKPTNSLKHAS